MEPCGPPEEGSHTGEGEGNALHNQTTPVELYITFEVQGYTYVQHWRALSA